MKKLFLRTIIILGSAQLFIQAVKYITKSTLFSHYIIVATVKIKPINRQIEANGVGNKSIDFETVIKKVNKTPYFNFIAKPYRIIKINNLQLFYEPVIILDNFGFISAYEVRLPVVK
jgi:hypothetical protein